jgi:hypothetical protein
MKKTKRHTIDDTKKFALAGGANHSSKSQVSQSSKLIKTELLDPLITKYAKLNPEERELLQECEKVVDRNKLTFLMAGEALATIRDKRLYRETHETFEDYTQERFGYGRAHTYRLMDACQVAKQLELVNEDLSPRGDIVCYEKLLRPLTSLDKEKRPEAWKKAIELADGKPVQAKHVLAVIPKKAKEASPAAGEPKMTKALAHVRKLLEQAKAEAQAVLDEHFDALLDEAIKRVDKAQKVRKEEAEYAAN